MDDKEQLVQQLKSAYRKFKAYSYYDNFGAINRGKLAIFEEKYKLSLSDNFFEKFADDIIDENERKVLFDKLTDEIGVLCYPKSIKPTLYSKDESEKCKTNNLGNIPDNSNKIDRLNYFIDLDVKAHILGTLWILRSGWILDHRLHKNCQGNRLSKEILSKIESCEKNGTEYLELTPFLFEPYFKKYQLWRDDGLETIEKLLDKDENAIMLSLDFKEYYYTSTIDFSKLKNDIQKAKSKLFKSKKSNKFQKNLNDALTNFIKDIFEKYTNKFERSYYESRELNRHLPMIPIGFLPSLIISNWNLQAFDQTILDFLNPSYYGRYVDDILIVFKSHPDSESFSQENLIVNPDQIIKKYFIEQYYDHNSNPEKKFNIFRKEGNEYFLNNLHEREFRYKPNEDHTVISHYENLRIQAKKLKIFRFNYNHSKALIENFKKEIYKNSSEFRLMHAEEKLYTNIGQKIFSIRYAESINKISSIESIKLNKFELSKTLSWLIRSSIYKSDETSKNNIKNIIDAFSGSKKIEYMILWEKLFEFLFITKKYEILSEEITKINNKISELTIEEDNDSTYRFLNSSEKLLKNSLMKFLFYTYARVLSLRYVKKEHLKNINELFLESTVYEKELSKKYVLSFLYKNSSMMDPLLLINYSPQEFKFLDDNNKFDLIKPKSQIKKEKGNYFYFYYPRFIQFHEATFHCINEIIKSDIDLDKSSYLKKSTRLYNLTNGFIDKTEPKDFSSIFKTNCETKCKCKFSDYSNVNVLKIKTGSINKKIVKIGLINTLLEEKVLENSLKGDPNRSSKRLDKIAVIINEAIIKKVELLVMPEMYIPFEWLPGILDISRKHGMAMVFGIEPVINKNKVGNYIGIALPSETDNHHKNCTFIMRLKNSYAPKEITEYKNHNLVPKTQRTCCYTLCIWNDLYFVPYYCYEIADIEHRSIFKSCCDVVIVSEYNKDTSYFTAIAESMSRDLFCYCIKVNSSEFGGTCILQPSNSENKYLVNLKGGIEDYVVTQNINIDKLRNHQIQAYASENKNTELKPKPPRFNYHIVRERMKLPSRK